MNKELLNDAIKKLAIRDITLRNTNIWINEKFDPVFVEYKTLSLQFRDGIQNCRRITTNDGNQNGTEHLAYDYECAFRAIPPDLPEEILMDTKKVEELILLEVTAVFSAYYECKEKLEGDELEEFSKFNVGYHVWPYWREYAASMANRIRLPNFTIPIYRIPE